ncbi:aliphatic sulfonate ABC transporter substrate-binding protein [Paenibacillus chitinolyticus]|uniref:aliphatic sulfonate ABC transporter substrate-binding protein n=1 Tax=Paenibacillus chitinolyticus TaxID=79263 RepID=UPI00364921A7
MKAASETAPAADKEKRRYRWAIPFAFLTILLLSGCIGKGEQALTEGAAPAGQNGKDKVTVSIGIQQSLGPLLIAREKKWFEEAFAKAGAEVKWQEFQSGPPHFESITAGRLDFGIVGNGPVIAAQAGKVEFKEIAVSGDGKKGNAILVPKGSPLQTVRDLKGKKIAVAKGSSGWIFLYRAIVQAGLKPDDIKIVQLQPDEARPAFQTGAVDAWAVWEPFITSEVVTGGASVLADGKQLDLLGPGFIVARSEFTREHPELTVLFLKTYEEARLWLTEHQEEAVGILAKAKKLDPEIVRKVLSNLEPLNAVITPEFVEAQQSTADFMLSQDAIKQKIDVTKVVDNSFIEQALKQAAAGK